MYESKEKYLQLIETLNRVGVALSAEKDHNRLLQMILTSAMDLTIADAGTLYLVHKESKLSFAIIANKSLHIEASKVFETSFPVISVPLYTKGIPNKSNIASYCYHENKTVSIDDAYSAQGFDFSGTRSADKRLGYHSKSFLTIPLRDHTSKIIGVLQLINALDEKTGKVIAFPEERILIAESLASQAAIILTKQDLILAQKKLFEALLHLIAKAIDEKSTHTSKHCSRVPVLTIMIANSINQASTGPFRDFRLSKDQFDELVIAAWLHDCGKIVTPDYIMNKSTKLETLTDRIEVIHERFEILKRDAKIEFLEKSNNAATAAERQIIKNEYDKKIDFLDESFDFIKQMNLGSETLLPKDKARIKAIARDLYYYSGSERKPLLSKREVENLTVSRGTLNEHERAIIKDHVRITQTMLKSLPYPDYLKNVPEIAGSHHERVDGTGYPDGKTRNDMSIQARILAIADIFEALTSADRPYKKPNSLKEVLSIMQDMKNTGHIDPDIYDIFINDKIYLNYALQYLSPEQIDT
jgi:HD-GYP domain-containing protein (c-di-GMP phosphodiesterase class II)